MYSYISEANQDKCGFWIGHIHIHVQLPNYSQTENQSSQVQVKSTFSFEVWFEIEKDQTCNVLRDATSEPLTGWDTNKSLRRVNWWVQHFITVWVHFDKDLCCICTPLLLSWCMSKNMSNRTIVAWCEGSIERLLHYWNHNRKRQLNLGHKTLPKAQRTRGLSSSYQSKLLRSWVLSTQSKFHPQNLDQESTSKSQPDVNISTKIQNLHQT